MGRFDDADRLDGHDEIGPCDGLQDIVSPVGNVHANRGVVTPHYRAEFLERTPPLAIRIARHQRDEDGNLVVRQQLRRMVRDCL